jgi:Tfp pilus assembly protein PilX
MKTMRRDHGGVMLILILVLLVVSALVGAVALRGSTGDLRMAGATRQAKTEFYCAEAGLAAARPYFANNIGVWNSFFTNTNVPPGYPVTGDLDGDNQPDYSVTLRDNVDEFPPPDNPSVDSDLTAIMDSVCISNTLAHGTYAGQLKVSTILTYTGTGGTDYHLQAGHSSSHTGNQNCPSPPCK